MKIASINASFPSRMVTNEDVVEILCRESKNTHNYIIPNPEALVAKLDSTQLKTRRWLANNESRIDLLSEAIDKSLQNAGLQKKDIDLIIYSSVHKQFKEPGDAFFIAKTLGFENTECFDVLEACNSFVRASNIAQAYLKADNYENVLVVTSEFMVHDDDHLSCFQIKDLRNLEYAFSTLTIGEGTTATIFTKSDNDWKQKIVGLPQHADYCFMTSSNITEQDKTKFNLTSQEFIVNQFVSYSLKLHKGGSEVLKDLIANSLEGKEMSDIVFPHTYSKGAWDKFEKELNTKIPYYYIFQDYGNLVSSSLPAGMYLAHKEGKLKRNMKVSAWMAAAGMSLSVTDFVF